MDAVEKAQRITEVAGPVNSPDEVRRRMPEVDAISDEEIREQVIEYFMRATPAYFWERPASTSGDYHPPDESAEHGLWLHTKRVFAAYANLSESFAEMQLISEYERDCGKAAALIHDTYQGDWPSSSDNWAADHDVIAAAVANYMIGLPEETVFLVHTHMGPWGGGTSPETNHELLFHLSDMSAADRNHQPGVYYPSSELREQFPNLSEIHVEDGEYI